MFLNRVLTHRLRMRVPHCVAFLKMLHWLVALVTFYIGGQMTEYFRKQKSHIDQKNTKRNLDLILLTFLLISFSVRNNLLC